MNHLTKSSAFFLAVALGLTGCGETTDGPLRPTPTDPTPEAPSSMRETPRDDLRWKRALEVENDLSAALELADGALCEELGTYRCLRLDRGTNAGTWSEPNLGGADAFFELMVPGGLHLVSLGGNDPFFRNQHRPLAEPIVTTATSLDRVALAACTARVDADAGSESVVFTHIDLAASPLSPDDPGVEPQARELYRRLLARDPNAEELDAVRGFLEEEPTSARDFAVAVCHAVATSNEFVFQ